MVSEVAVVMNVAGTAAAAFWCLIGLMFMVTAGHNWHEVLLTEHPFTTVNVKDPGVRNLFGMLTHSAFFIGELNWSLGTTHLMNSLGFSPAIAICPAISLIAYGVFVVYFFREGPTGLPIHGPPAPIPQLAMMLGLIVNANVMYQFFGESVNQAANNRGIVLDSTADRAPAFLNMQENYLRVYFVAFALIFVIPVMIARYHRTLGLPDWRGDPVVRPSDKKH